MRLANNLRQNENATVVFQRPQKDRHYSVAPHVSLVPGLKEDISFVKKHDTTPAMSEAKAFVQIFLDFVRSLSNVAFAN